MRRILTALAALVLLSPSALFAQALADRVPADVFLYVGRMGTETPGSGFQGSHFQAVLADTNFKAVFDDVIPQIISKLSHDDPAAVEHFKKVFSMAGPFWKHPAAIFLQPSGDPNAPVRAGIICNAGADGKDLLKQLNELVSQGGPNAQQFTQISEVGDLVVVTLGIPAPNGLLPAPDGETLAKDPTFAAALKETVADPFLMVYVNVEFGLSVIDRVIADQGERAGQAWTNFRESTGLNGLQRIAVAGKFDGKDWTTSCFVETPAPRKGLVALFDTKPIGPAEMAMIPSTAATAQVGRFDFAALLKECRNVCAAIDPQAAQKFDQGIGALQMMIGKNPITDVLEPLGDTWVMYSDANVAGNTLDGVVVINKLDDPAKGQLGLNSLWIAASNMVNGMMRQQQRRGGGAQPQPPPVTLTQEKVGNLTVAYAQTPVQGFGWTINDGKLFVGFSKDGITKGATAPPPAQGFDQNAKFAALHKKLGGGEITSFKFADLPQTAPGMYERLTKGLASARQMAQQQGITLPEKLLPSIETIQANIAPSAEVAWTDAAGFHSRAYKPFPLSDVFSNAPNGAMAEAGAAAAGVAVLLPATARSREVANRVKCASNQRQIGQAILLYANENKGKYPPDLGTLILTQDVTADVFICPDSGTKRPPDAAHMKPAEIADWVNKNSDYVYVGQGLDTNKIGPQQIVLYEKPEAHGTQGMNLLYGDGHVEFQLMRQANRLIEQQGK